jgi:putative ABC transport system permease protein
VILLLIVLSVLNTINLSMFERRGEFGTMRAIGNTNHAIFMQIVTEAFFLGVSGSLIGMVAGWLLAHAISIIGIPMPPPPNSELGYVAQIRLHPTAICTAVAIGILASAAASLLPARRLSRMPIVEGLRQNV